MVENPDELPDTFEIHYSLRAYLGVPNGRYQVYQNERTSASAVLKDLGYLLGLKRAVKLLRDALADPDRKDIKCKFKVVPIPNVNMPMNLPLPGCPPPPMPMPPQYVPPMSPTTMQEQFRAVAKDLVKDTMKECKNEGSVMESVQQEMIKLLRDVCRDALQKKE